MEKKVMNNIVKEICKENNINCYFFCYDWVIKLDNNNNNMLIYGYKFPNNNAALEQVCDDKSALSSLLSHYQIPNVFHEFFMRQSREINILSNEMENRLLSLFHKHKKLVIKNNSGTGGIDVYKVETVDELYQVTTKLFQIFRTIAVSPFIEIKNEYRIIVSNKKIKVVYQKIRPFIIGNGKDNIATLIKKKYQELKNYQEFELDYILKENEFLLLNWKHNLAQGAIPQLVTDLDVLNNLTYLANLCIDKLDINFASIDIVFDGQSYMVLEINSGVMMEKFASYNEEFYQIAKEIYKDAILTYLKIR